MDRIRLIQNGDRSELASLWSLRFHDSPGFIDWFFANRCCTDYSMCMEADGKIVSVIHAWPMQVQLRSMALPALMIAGVATLPGYEKQGRMHRIMEALLTHARENGFLFALHRPVNAAVYASISHLPCTQTLLHRVENGADKPRFCEDWDAEALLCIYRAATARYSCIVLRDEAVMRLKLMDYRSDGARLIRPDGLKAYAVLFEQEAGWYAEEAFVENADDYPALLSALPDGALVKLPPDLAVSGEQAERNVLGAINVPELLKALSGDAHFSVNVHDPLLPQNCGCFDGCGAPYAGRPDLTCTSGELMQYLCGYHALSPWFSKQCCFCVDEY